VRACGRIGAGRCKARGDSVGCVQSAARWRPHSTRSCRLVGVGTGLL